MHQVSSEIEEPPRTRELLVCKKVNRTKLVKCEQIWDRWLIHCKKAVSFDPTVNVEFQSFRQLQYVVVVGD